MAKFIIEVEQALNSDTEYIVRDTYEMYRKALRGNAIYRYEFEGKEHTVVVFDIFGELNREICLKLAIRYLKGQYRTYTYATGEWTDGEPK